MVDTQQTEQMLRPKPKTKTSIAYASVLFVLIFVGIAMGLGLRDVQELISTRQTARQQLQIAEQDQREATGSANSTDEAKIIDGRVPGPERPVGFRAYLPGDSRAANWPVIFLLPARHMSVERAYAHLGHRLARHDYVLIVVDYQEPLNIVSAPVEELRETLRGQDHSENPEIIRQLRVDTLALFAAREQIRAQLPQEFHRIDMDRVGLIGHLSGGLQVQLLVGARLDSSRSELQHAAFQQQPQGLLVQAAAIYSPYGRDHVQIPFSRTEPPWAKIQTPLLLINGDRDLHFSKRLMSSPTNDSLFRELAPTTPAFSMNLINGTTADFMGRRGRERPDSEGPAAISAVTRIFFDAYLRGSERDLKWLKSLALSANSESDAQWAQGRRVRDTFNRIQSKATTSSHHAH